METLDYCKEFSSPFINNYEGIQLIKSGAFGIVYRASRKEVSNPKLVAIKLVELTLNTSLTKARKEIENVKDLRHEHITQIFDHWLEKPPVRYVYPERGAIKNGCKEGVLFIEMEYGEFGSLKEWLTVNWRKREYATILFYQITSGLTFLHQNHIIHRDLKPDNIILFRETQSETIVAKIADFGISSEIKTRMTSRIGTEGYMAPEVNLPGGIYTEKADLYSLGVIYYEMLIWSDRNKNDVKLYQNSEILDVVRFQPNGFAYHEDFFDCLKEERSLLDMMLQKDPNDRQSADSILNEFRQVHSNLELKLPIPNYVTKEMPGEFRMHDDKVGQIVFQGITSIQSTALTILNLNRVKINSCTFTSFLKDCVHLAEIDMVVIRENENELFEKICLPQLRKFFYRQLNGPIDAYDTVKYLTPKQLDSIFFAGEWGQIVQSEIAVLITVTRFVVVNIKHEEEGADAILGFCYTKGLFENVMKLHNTKSLYLNVVDDMVDMTEFLGLKNLSTFFLDSRLLNAFEHLYSFENLETLNLTFSHHSAAFNQNYNPETICLSKFTPKLKNLTLHFAEVCLKDVSSLIFQTLNLINCIFKDGIQLENISPDVVSLQEISIYYSFDNFPFYKPTWKLLNKLIEWNCEKISCEKFDWDSYNGDGLIDYEQLQSWGIRNKGLMFTLEKDITTGKWVGKSIEYIESSAIHRKLVCREKFEIPETDDEFYSPSSKKLPGLFVISRFPIFDDFQDLQSYTMDGKGKSFEFLIFNGIPKNAGLQKLILKNCTVIGSEFLIQIMGCKQLINLTLDNIHLEGDFTKFINLEQLREFNFLVVDTQFSMERFKSILIFNKRSFTNLWSRKINILISSGPRKLLEFNHNLQSIFIGHLEFSEDILNECGLSENRSKLEKLVLFYTVINGTLPFHNLTYLSLMQVKIDLEKIGLKSQFPNLQSFFFHPRRCRTTFEKFDLSSLPPLKTVGLYTLTLIIKEKFVCDTLTIENCRLTSDFYEIFSELLSVKKLNLIGGYLYQPNAKLFHPIFYTQHIITQVFVHFFDWGPYKVSESIKSRLSLCGLDVLETPRTFSLLRSCSEKSNHWQANFYNDAPETKIFRILSGNEEINIFEYARQSLLP